MSYDLFIGFHLIGSCNNFACCVAVRVIESLLIYHNSVFTLNYFQKNDILKTKEVDNIFSKIKSYTKRDWMLLGITTFMASIIFILIQYLLDGFDSIGDIILNFIIFFLIFGSLQALFGGIFHNNKTK